MNKDIEIKEIGLKGKITSSFGKTGKIKVTVMDMLVD